MVETMIRYADNYDLDIVYPSETPELDEESIYSAITDSEEESSESETESDENPIYIMVLIKEEGETSRPKDP